MATSDPAGRAMPLMPDLVQTSRLECFISPDAQTTTHFHFSGNSRKRDAAEPEVWTRKRVLGRGSYGVVYLEECSQGSQVGAAPARRGELRAVKAFSKPQDMNYYRELEALAFFSSPQYERWFVRSRGWFETEEKAFIAMDFYPLGDLQSYLRGPLPEIQGQSLASQILEALSYMHENDFAHRDLKPANILVETTGPTWKIKLADFGVSKRVTGDVSALRTIAGTPAFVAPEVLGYQTLDVPDAEADLDRSYTNAVDIWSVGVILLLILTGESPFRDQRQLGRYACGLIRLPGEDALKRLTSNLASQIVGQLLAVNPSNRPTASQVLEHDWFRKTPEELAEIREQNGMGRSASTETSVAKRKSSLVESSFGDASAAWSTQVRIPNLSETAQTASSNDTGLAEDMTSLAIRSRQDRGEDTSREAESRDQDTLEPTRTAVHESGGSAAGATEVSIPPTQDVEAATARQIPRVQETQELIMDAHEPAHSTLPRVVRHVQDSSLPQAAEQDSGPRQSTAQGFPVTRLHGHTDQVVATAFSKNGDFLVSASRDGTVRLWNTSTGAQLAKHSGFDPHDVEDVAVSPDGSMVAAAMIHWDPQGGPMNLETMERSGWARGMVRVWGSESGELGTIRHAVGHASVVDFSPDGKTLASGSREYSISLWDAVTRSEVEKRKGPLGREKTLSKIESVNFSPDGRLLAVAYHASFFAVGHICLWNVARHSIVGKFKGSTIDEYASCVQFSPRGDLLAAGYDHGDIRMWNVATRAKAAGWGDTEESAHKHQGQIRSLAFALDGLMLVSGDYGTVQIWEVATGTRLRSVKLESQMFSTLAPDSRLMASRSDTVIELRDISGMLSDAANKLMESSAKSYGGSGESSKDRGVLAKLRPKFLS